jgi:hypothetical protein
MDLAALEATTPAATITSATATLTREGYADVVRALSVAGGVATGQIDALAPGYWHVAVEVYDGATLIYTGAADVNVIAGSTVACTILFDPVVVPPTTGSVTITVGLNPMPGYTAIDQTVSDLLFDRSNHTLYVVDRTTNVIGIYDADTLVRTRDLQAPGAPLSAALAPGAAGIYLGYASGHVRLLDVATGQDTLVADVLMEAQRLAPLTERFLLVAGPGSYSYTSLKVVDVTTGQIVSARSPYYSMTELLYNPRARTVYSHHQGVSPTDIHYIKVDEASGALLSDGDSVYHGDYSFGRPLRLVDGGTRIATSSGGMFTSAALVADDLRYAGSIGYTYVDLGADDTLGKLYLLNSAGIMKLLVIDQETYFVERSVQLSGTPARVFETPDSVIVLATKDARTYAKAFPKADLGL